MKPWQAVVRHLEKVLAKKISLQRVVSLAGGSINEAWAMMTESGRFFVKTNRSGKLSMFEAEARGLDVLRGAGAIRVPEVIGYGDDGRMSYIVMKFLEMGGGIDQRRLGESLANLHRHHGEAFGWERENTIGITPQVNRWREDWCEFWQQRRIGYQLDLAKKNGYGGVLQSLGERLMVAMPALFDGREIHPSMLHGDLWGGNVAALKDGEPVIFDPAFYFGDRETDIAMTYLFGGFSQDFYSAYEDRFPLDEGFPVRRQLYNLYHVINHLNMFGGGYHGQAVTMMEQLLGEL